MHYCAKTLFILLVTSFARLGVNAKWRRLIGTGGSESAVKIDLEVTVSVSSFSGQKNLLGPEGFIKLRVQASPETSVMMPGHHSSS